MPKGIRTTLVVDHARQPRRLACLVLVAGLAAGFAGIQSSASARANHSASRGTIYFLRRAAGPQMQTQVWAMSATGADPHPISTDPYTTGGSGALMCGASLVSRRLVLLETINTDYDAQFFTTDLDGAHLQQITHTPSKPGATGAFHPPCALSSDGLRVAYLDGENRLSMMRVDGTNRRRLTPWQVDWGFSYSPAGSEIVLIRTVYQLRHGKAYTHPVLQVVDVNTGVIATILSFPDRSDATVAGPVFSPSGREILYACRNTSVCAVSRHGSDPHVLMGAGEQASTGGSQIVWSPDGHQIAVACGHLGRNICVANADGKSPHVVGTGTVTAWVS